MRLRSQCSTQPSAQQTACASKISAAAESTQPTTICTVTPKNAAYMT